LIILQLLLSMAAILAMAYVFINSVEMLGDRIGISQGGVGSALAALSTVLPWGNLARAVSNGHARHVPDWHFTRLFQAAQEEW
jgi:hypothetical protein